MPQHRAGWCESLRVPVAAATSYGQRSGKRKYNGAGSRPSGGALSRLTSVVKRGKLQTNTFAKNIFHPRHESSHSGRLRQRSLR